VTALSRLFAKLAELPPATNEVAIDRDLTVPVGDGVSLLADRWHPATHPRAGEYPPIVLIRTPYGRRGPGSLIARVVAERGYQVVVVSCRGTHGSGGEWLPFRNEKRDGAAVLEWLAGQPWFVPNVMTAGPSYVGMTQWAVAADAPSWVKGMSMAVTSSWFRDVVYPGDVFAYASMLAWLAAVDDPRGGVRDLLKLALSGRKLKAAAAAPPLSRSDTVMVGHQVDYDQDWLAHESRDDPWWADIDFSPAIATMPPVAMVAGWYDLFLPNQLEDFKRLQAAGRQARIVIGPWTHGDRAGMAAHVREILDWAKVTLRGSRDARTTSVRVNVLGSDNWLDLPSWPPPAQASRYHLSQEGTLTTGSPTGAPDRYRFDPRNPTPSIGGAWLAGDAGAKDNKDRERRDDVLTYTTDVLDHDVLVVGELTAELFVQTSSEHVDFFVRLCDVSPPGRSVNISDGIVRLPSAAGEVQPDGSLRVRLRMYPTAAVFRRGHRLRLQVSSGAHPVYPANPGSGEPLGKATAQVAVDVTVLHDAEHPSCVTLPVHEPLSQAVGAR
jgi:putative CocE/NonD family hydrolase